MESGKQVPCITGWITMPPEEARIIGSRCESCGHYFFPKVTNCHNPDCRNRETVKDAPLSQRGTLYSYTINYFQPPPPYHSPNPFTPFGIVCVDLPEGIKVSGQVPRSVKLDKLKIGMEMEVVREVLYVDEQGVEVLSWMFKPVA
jgi:uncharacterized OB-fold protein